ncbi:MULTISPECIES: hypothetical protein [Nonlabens]|nr:hypothetical protein [Nonlabens ulvanivorans]
MTVISCDTEDIVNQTEESSLEKFELRDGSIDIDPIEGNTIIPYVRAVNYGIACPTGPQATEYELTLRRTAFSNIPSENPQLFVEVLITSTNGNQALIKGMIPANTRFNTSVFNQDAGLTAGFPFSGLNRGQASVEVVAVNALGVDTSSYNLGSASTYVYNCN